MAWSGFVCVGACACVCDVVCLCVMCSVKYLCVVVVCLWFMAWDVVLFVIIRVCLSMNVLFLVDTFVSFVRDVLCGVVWFVPFCALSAFACFCIKCVCALCL